MTGVTKKNVGSKSNSLLTAVVANQDGEIFELKGFAAVGMAGTTLVPLSKKETREIPYGGELMFLPDRNPILFNMDTKEIETLKENPYTPGESIFPVAAFNSPGYVNTYVCAYKEKKDARYLPLFSYGAVGWKSGKFRSAVICVDQEKRQDLRLMNLEKVVAGVNRIKKKMPDNRLREHIEKCALKYSCPAAKNFFLGRYEAPLPVSRKCNAKCLGCLSLQKPGNISVCQERISFTPTPDEIAQIALEHIMKVKHGIVSFGQGCEGDPLLAADVIEPAIIRIRSTSKRGTINMNSNGSLPDILEKLFAAGLDSIRISLNSVRKACYNTYFQPAGYKFEDVEKSIDIAIKNGKYVSINYLNYPGVTDSTEEVSALTHFLKQHPINLIQWRNLNFDPMRYWKIMCNVTKNSKPLGIKQMLNQIQNTFPEITYGYFNPPKEKFKRHTLKNKHLYKSRSG